MDITKVTSVETCKALAYDQLVVIEQAKANLVAINQQIAKLSEKKDEKAE